VAPNGCAQQKRTMRWTIGISMASHILADRLARNPASRMPDEPYGSRAPASRAPRILLFLVMGGLGFVTDVAVFTLLFSHDTSPLLARAVSMATATLVTWCFNRTITSSRRGQWRSDDTARDAAVTLTSQAMSFIAFTVLVLTVCTSVPEVALVAGSVIGAIISWYGQGSNAFAPRNPVHVSRS
jgi:putative flippase GtrA